MKKNYLLAMLVALIFLSCNKTDDQVTALAAEQNKSGVLNKKSGYKEIEGVLTYKATTAFDMNCYTCNEGSFTGNFYGTGELEHLGTIGSQTKACASYIMSGNAPIGIHIYNQCCNFIAPNGDEIILTTKGYDLYFNQSGVAIGQCNFCLMKPEI